MQNTIVSTPKVSSTSSTAKVNDKASRFAALKAKVESQDKPNYNDPDAHLYWKIEQDVAGNGTALIRFLPAKTGEAYPYVQLFTHGFKGPTGKWYIENCPTSIGDDCPVCKANQVLWNIGDDASKKIVSARKQIGRAHV